MKRITNPSLVAGKGFILHTKRNNISLEIFFFRTCQNSCFRSGRSFKRTRSLTQDCYLNKSFLNWLYSIYYDSLNRICPIHSMTKPGITVGSSTTSHSCINSSLIVEQSVKLFILSGIRSSMVTKCFFSHPHSHIKGILHT